MKATNTKLLSFILAIVMTVLTLSSCSGAVQPDADQTSGQPSSTDHPTADSTPPDDPTLPGPEDPEDPDKVPEDLPPEQSEMPEVSFPWGEDKGDYLYVSASRGSDSKDASSPGSAVKTLERAYAISSALISKIEKKPCRLFPVMES